MKEINEAFELFDQGEYDQAEELYLACLKELGDQKSDSYKAVLNGLGYVKSHQGEFGEARKYINEVLEIAIEQADKMEEAMALHQLGMVERMAGEFESALDLFTKEAAIWKAHFPDFTVGFSANSYERGYIAIKQERYGEAAELLQSSLQYAKSAKSLVAEGCACRGLGELELSRNRAEKAAGYFQQALAAFEEAEDLTGAAEIWVFLKQC